MKFVKKRFQVSKKLELTHISSLVFEQKNPLPQHLGKLSLVGHVKQTERVLLFIVP